MNRKEGGKKPMGRSSRRSFATLLAGTVAAAALGGVVAAPSVARADAPAKAAAHADVMVLYATQEPGAGSIDPQIGSLPQLKQPPFSAYNTYRLLDRKTHALAKGDAAKQNLANGRVLQVTLSDVTPDGRYRVAVHIDTPGGKSFLKLLEVTAAPNETFFVAGQSYKDGILVLGITMKP